MHKIHGLRLLLLKEAVLYLSCAAVLKRHGIAGKMRLHDLPGKAQRMRLRNAAEMLPSVRRLLFEAAPFSL